MWNSAIYKYIQDILIQKKIKPQPKNDTASNEHMKIEKLKDLFFILLRNTYKIDLWQNIYSVFFSSIPNTM